MRNGDLKKMSSSKSKEKPIKKNFQFIPENITLKDDAFHGSNALSYTEWWYFDANLDNGYSIQMHIRVGSLLKNRFVVFFQKMDLYKDKKLITSKRRIFSKKHVFTSEEIPNVKINGKDIIKGHIDKKTGKIIYELNFEIDNIAAFLKFEGSGKGFKGTLGKQINKKGTTKQGKWAVILPYAIVNGKIKIQNKIIDVKGYGYHDHNWDMRGLVITEYGWFWGRLYTKDYTLIWARILETKSVGSNLLIISNKNNGYTNFKSNDIKLTQDDYKKEKGGSIPHHFTLIVKNDKISLDLNMKALDVHHTRVMGFTNYYRYHMSCKGIITIDSKKEKIDSISICEFFRFG
jgi:predicted secreted hydrolase